MIISHGIALNKKSGYSVKKGDVLAYIFIGDETLNKEGFDLSETLKETENLVLDAYTIKKEA